MVCMIGHRGYSSKHLENTAPVLLFCRLLRPDFVESDRF